MYLNCWRLLDSQIYLTIGETARRLGVTKNALEVAKYNLKKGKDSRKRKYKDLFDFAIEIEGNTWFLEDGVAFFIEKLQAKENLQYKLALIISEMSNTMGLTNYEIAEALGVNEYSIGSMVSGKSLPGYNLCKQIMCSIIKILNYKPYIGGDWNADQYLSEYNNDVTYFEKVGE